jgi:hypothetical protein
MKMISPVNRPAVFLLFTLWAFLILTVLCYGLALRTKARTRATGGLIDRARARELAVSGISLGRRILVEERNNGNLQTVHLNGGWALPCERRVTYRAPGGEGLLNVRISDESARFDLNTFEGELLFFFNWFQDRGAIDNGQRMAVGILDYRDSDTVERLVSEVSTERTSEGDPLKNAPLRSPLEFSLIPAIDDAGHALLDEVATVFGGRRQINVNTASFVVLEALFDFLETFYAVDPGVYTDIRTIRLGDDGQEMTEDDRYILPGFLETWSNAHQEPEKARRAFETYCTTTGSLFRVDSVAAVDGVEHRVRAVCDTDSEAIIYWHEE